MPAGRFWLILAALLILAAGVRFYRLGADEYWLDELHSLANSAGMRAEFEAFPYGELFTNRPRATDLDDGSSLAAVWRGMRDDTHPPLYFLLLNGWRKVFGDSEAATRSLSAIFSVLSIVPIALLFRRIGRPAAGLWAALVLTLSFSHIYMAQQNRQYSLALFLISLSYWAFAHASAPTSAGRTRRNALAWASYSLSVYLCLLTHYFTALALLGHAIHAAARLRGWNLRCWLAASVLASAGMVVTWGGVFIHQTQMIGRQAWLNDGPPEHIERSLYRLADAPVRLLIQQEPFRISPLRSLVGVLIVSTCAGLLLHRRPPGTLLMGVWFAVPCIGLLALDLMFEKQAMNHVRYPVVAVGGLAGLLGLAMGEFRPALQAVFGLTFCAATGLSLSTPTASNPDAKQVAAMLESELSPDDLVVFDAIGWPDYWIPHFYAPIEYYMPEFTNPRLLLNEPQSVTEMSFVGTFERIWVISPRVDAIPNPAPDTHGPAGRSDYIWQIGWVYVFVAKTSGPD